jgi:hypothetical protein
MPPLGFTLCHTGHRQISLRAGAGLVRKADEPRPFTSGLSQQACSSPSLGLARAGTNHRSIEAGNRPFTAQFLRCAASMRAPGRRTRTDTHLLEEHGLDERSQSLDGRLFKESNLLMALREHLEPRTESECKRAPIKMRMQKSPNLNLGTKFRFMNISAVGCQLG